LHAKPHVPDEHVDVAFVTVGQTFAHIPQLDVLVLMFTSQPFDASPSQSA
jgi:hypothetical protein